MKILKKSEIDKGFERSQRTYLCGNLRIAAESEHIHTDAYEIGITEYKEYTAEKPHRHTFNDKFNYVIEGRIKVLLLSEKREEEFGTGDLFVITPNEPYACKATAGTRVIFSKVPGGNDKVLERPSADIKRWSASWDAVYGEIEA